jgi:hypothetical protein
VRELISDTRVAGAYDVKWDGRDESGQQVASGVCISTSSQQAASRRPGRWCFLSSPFTHGMRSTKGPSLDGPFFCAQRLAKSHRFGALPFVRCPLVGRDWLELRRDRRNRITGPSLELRKVC